MAMTRGSSILGICRVWDCHAARTATFASIRARPTVLGTPLLVVFGFDFRGYSPLLLSHCRVNHSAHMSYI